MKKTNKQIQIQPKRTIKKRQTKMKIRKTKSIPTSFDHVMFNDFATKIVERESFNVE